MLEDTQTCVDIIEKKQSMAGYCIGGGEFQLGELVGAGTFGQVYKAIDNNGRPHAIKAILSRNNRYSGKRVDARVLSSEINVLSHIPPHHNVVHLEKVFHSDRLVFMVFEYCNNSDLYRNIMENPAFNSPTVIKSVYLQLLCAVNHLHAHDVYHRDLKPENIMIAKTPKKNSDGCEYTVKLVDFGLSTTDLQSSELGCGSLYYTSPECNGVLFGNSTYNCEKNDIWALGVILVNLTTKCSPWNKAVPADPRFAKFLASRSFFFSMANISIYFNSVLRKVLNINPNNRCSIKKLAILVSKCNRFTINKKSSDSQPLFDHIDSINDSSRNINYMVRRSSSYEYSQTYSYMNLYKHPHKNAAKTQKNLPKCLSKFVYTPRYCSDTINTLTSSLD
ncbi:hypothetical protein BB561_001719 [Smittium simulii]|uniref:Protein kinase domain-containing protein n=1 Tax=Smittium simulii TaxID=133385 RepID=A0A2T9YTH2_9FUNG|nr:hypothetical protein BB561_001719 [Smittium simulii]